MKNSILVVDDNPNNLHILVELLEKHEFEVIAIRNSSTVLDILKNQIPDLILLDIIMPEIDGFALCRQIKSIPEYSNIPIIFISALHDVENKIKAFHEGGVDFITKPFQQEEVLARVNTHLELFKLTNNLQEQVNIEIQKNAAKEKLLLQQEKMALVGELINVIAHQWKQPLNTIYLLSQLIDNYISEEGKEFTKQLKTQIDFMNDTVNDFREFLKPSKEKKFFLACEIIVQVSKMFSDLFIQNNIQVLITEHTHFNTYGFENEFKHVILNLFTNSVAAFQQNQIPITNRTIICSFQNHTSYNRIFIRDNAGGIDASLLPEKLFQAYVSTKGEKGTGIGLHIVKNIVENHMNGKIYVQNVDDGAEFSIELPAIDLE